MHILKSSNKNTEIPEFSILIPSWNNLEYLKLCLKSIMKNSKFKHQIIVHINEGNDGSLEWVKKNEIDFSFSKNNIGICYALNTASTLAKTKYIVYMNDDMYVLPDWDLHLWNEIIKLPDDNFFLSSTMIEPTNTNNPCVISSNQFGTDVQNFKENDLLKHYKNFEISDWSGATWPPNIVSKRIWDLVVGYSIEYSPGFTSDPDFSMKLWQVGVRYFKGISQSRVFHFQCKSTHRITRNNGKKTFTKKWGLSAKRFTDTYLLRGKEFSGPLKDPDVNKLLLLIDNLKSCIK